MIAQLFLFVLPVIVFLANIFSVNGWPEGILTLVLCALMMMSVFANRRAAYVRVDITPKIVLTLLPLYTLISASLVLPVSSDAGFKQFSLLLLSLYFVLWLLLCKCFVADQVERNFHYFCGGVLLVSIVYLLLVASILVGGYSSRVWAEVSNNLLPKRNDISIFLLAGLCGYVFLDFGYSTRTKAIFCFLIIAAILFTFSRSAYLALLVVLAYFMIRAGNRKIILALLVIVGLYVFYSSGNPVLDRISYTFDEDGFDDSTSGRVEVWWLALSLAGDSPVFGVGAGRSPYWGASDYGLYGESIKYAHNYFITQLYQLGMIGFGLTVTMFWMYVHMASRLPSGPRSFATSVLLVIVVVSLTGEPMYGYGQYLFAIIYASMMYRLNRARVDSC